MRAIQHRHGHQRGDTQGAGNPAALPEAPLRPNPGKCKHDAPRSKRDPRAIRAIRGLETAQSNRKFPIDRRAAKSSRGATADRLAQYAKSLQDIDNKQLTVT
jgi:hypothetical protein